MRAAPRSLLLLSGLALAGCEPMEPSGNPFQPVRVQATTTSPVAAPAADPRFAEFDQEPETYSSEELRAMASGNSSEQAPVPEPPPTDAAPAQPEAPPVEVSPPAAAAPPAPVLMPRAALGWAVRLVTTVPNAQPPRAILGLPDGSEIVVTPGAMVPDAGLVVLAIGPQAVQLARVQASGDHADVEAFSLTPQY